MSSPSTPRSTRSASPAGDSPNVLTPGQKIKAMMAQFDSDSEPENQNTKTSRPIPKLDFGTKTTETRETAQSSHSGEDSDDEDNIVRPKGRMAARMQGNLNESTLSESTEESAFARLSKSLRTEREHAQKPQQKGPAPEADSSDDDLPTAVPRRNHGKMRQSLDVNDQSPPRSRTASPLFVSPAPPRHDDPSQSETAEETGEHLKGNHRFHALVAQKRKEREEREKAEAEQKAARRSQMEQFSSEVLSGEESGADDEGAGSKLSQKARQPRKASKKAMDEMHRETQRMSRNMQLAHQAQTKKKISKESFFARFNFMQPNAPPAEPPAANSSSTAGSQNSSDAEAHAKTHDTPHTSPVIAPSDVEKPAAVETTGLSQRDISEMKTGDTPDLPTLQGALASAKDESKSSNGSIISPAVVAAAQADTSVAKTKEPFQMTRPAVRVLMSRQEVARHQKDDSDSEDDLEVVTSPAKCRRIAAFENLPGKKMQESASMTKLKALAHLTSPTRKASSMNSAELSASLLYKARQQAAKDRRERIEELRAKGVVIETAEDRAAMEDDVEDLVEKARKEADDIAREERAAKKKAQGLDDDDEGDDEYQLSGSEDDGSGNEDDDNKSVGSNHHFVEQEADEGDDSSDNESDGPASDEEIEVPGTRRKRPTRVVSDDEEEEEAQIPSTPVRPPSNAARSAERPQLPGMETPGMSMGLTQAFVGTLADDAGSQAGPANVPFSLPDPGRPVPRLHAEESEILVRDSQEQSHEPEFMANHTPTVTRVSESPAGHRFSQFSQLPDPTQDEGFVFSPFDPSKRFRGTPPVSTVDTVLVEQSQSPVAERKARHLRRGRATELSTVEENGNEGDFEINAKAFDVMKNASKKKKKEAVAYDRKKSEAKGVVDEAAEESEDEYAGLGGGSDDSEGEEDALDEQMINDNSGEKVDEKQLAALNASHDRDRDEKDVAKLMKDITTGALRRRRGADDDFDLDDSDDERVARRREKQREFAKMRRALLADDKVGELAENPKKAAFFKAIEDREVEDDFDLDFLGENENDSQNESTQDVAPESQAEGDDDSAQDGKKRKRPLEATAEDATNRPPPHLRRTPASAMSKKPATLAEIRETLSFLTETPEYDSFHEDASLDEANGEEDDSNTANPEDAQAEDEDPQPEFAVPSHPRRTRAPVVDRLALLRKASSNSASGSGSGSGSGNTKLAFHGGSAEGPVGFRPPQLLRRVTSGSSSSSSSNASHRVTKSGASGPKKGGAVNSYTAAREKEREKQLRMKQRNGGSNIAKLLSKHSGGGLGGLAGKGQWE